MCIFIQNASMIIMLISEVLSVKFEVVLQALGVHNMILQAGEGI
jgi:hypothetical protein